MKKGRTRLLTAILEPAVQDLPSFDETIETCGLDAEDYPCSKSYHLLLVVKSTLIIFLAVSSLYNTVWGLN